MDHIAFDRVLSVTSEDKVHCASNLLGVRNAGLKWLSCPEDQSGRMEAELALQQPSCIKSVSVRNFGSAFIELLVGAGEGGPYLTLLPSKMVMTPQESKKGLHRTGMLVITEEKLSHKAAEGSWARVLIRCRQPFKRDEQFGLSSLILSTNPSGPSNAIPSSPREKDHRRSKVPKLTLPYSSREGHTLSPPPLKKLDVAKDKVLSPRGFGLVTLPSDCKDLGGSSSGRPLSPLHPSPTLHKLMAELNQKQLQEEAPAKLEIVQRQRFLTREIPRMSCKTTSYMSSYQQRPAEDKSLDFSRLKQIVAADDEVKGMRRRGRRGQRPHPQATKLGGWLATRAAGKGVSAQVGGDSDVKKESAEEEEKLQAEEVGSTTCIIDLTEDVGECPLCWFKFPRSIIQTHCDLCFEDLERFSLEQAETFSLDEPGACEVVVLD